LVPPALAALKPKVTSPGFGSPQWQWKQWGIGAGLSSGGNRGKVVKGCSSGPYIGLRVPVGSYNCHASYLPLNQGLIQEFVVYLDFFSLIRSIGDKSISIALNLGRCRFGMSTVLWAHNVHGGEACWSWWGKATTRQHGREQPVMQHGDRAWQRDRPGDSFPRGWASAGPQQQAT
jgi:hypothetical protein